MSFILKTSTGQETVVAAPVHIGRGPECEIQLAGGLVSRVHAQVWLESGQLLVRDQRSSNGTFVNGRPLTPGEASVLRPGDLLRIGETTFTVAVGTWQAAAPPERPRQDVAEVGGPPSVTARAPASAVAAPAPAAMAPYAARKQAGPWRAVGLGAGILAVGVVVIVLLVGTVGIAAFLLYRPSAGGPVTGGQTPTPAVATTTFEKLDMTVVKADGVAVSDAHGVALTAPTGSLETGVVAQMTSYKISGGIAQALSDQYDLAVPFYSITAPGKNGSTRSLALSFPATSPQSRVLVVIDQQYLGVLDVLPQNGKLTVTTLAGPEDTQGLKPVGTGTPGGSISYSVITPKAGSASVSPALAPRARRIPAAAGQFCWPKNPGPYTGGIHGRGDLLCRKNAAGTIFVFFPMGIGMTLDEADNVVQEADSRMNAYAAAGFTAAKLTPGSNLSIIVTQPGGDPQYSPADGVIYLPLDAARDIPGQGKLLTHEMGHWIQHAAYYMISDYWVTHKQWWLEVSAEDMVMVIQPDYINFDMSFYGPVDAKGYDLVFQYSPYQYPYVMYVQSQLVMVNMCDKLHCPITKLGFIGAINNGTFPFDNEQAKALVDQNMKDYAAYLVGVAPSQANTAIPLTAVQSQSKYGQNVTIREFKGNPFMLLNNGIAPQMNKQSKNEMDSLVIQAALQRDGVYPLEITTGYQGKFAGLPAMLTISAGTPFYYRLDGGAPQFSDGSTDLVLGPIHPTLGIGSVRLVAFSVTGGQTFSARLDLVDLQGAWVIQPGKLVSNNVTCTGDGDVSGANQMSPRFPELSDFLTGTGNMTADANGPKVSWSLVPSRLPADLKPSDFVYTASAQLSADSIQLQTNATFPEKKSGTLPGGTRAVGLAWLAIIPAVRRAIQLARGISRQKRRSVVMLLILSALLMTSCVGENIHGNVGSQVTITGLKYEGGDQKVAWTMGKPTTGKSVWAFTQGTATYQINMIITTSTTNPDTKAVTKQNATCTGTMVYEVTGGVYPDLAIVIPKNTGK